MSGPYRVSGKNGRVSMYCETCGKVDGPLPFGRDEVRLTMTTDGAFCQDHMPREVHHVAQVKRGVDSVKRVTSAPVEIQAILDFIRDM